MNEVALEGDLEHFLPSEILQFLLLVGATGRLELERPGERAELFLDGGRPVSAHTSGRSVHLGEALIRQGALSREELAQALAQQRDRPQVRLGTLIAERGWSTREQVEQGIHEVVKRVLYGIMLWPRGRFRFAPGARAERTPITVELELDRLIFDGLRQADERLAMS